MAEIKIVSMIREVPEVPGSPTKMDVQECDVEKLKARGWTVVEKTKEDPVETPKEKQVDTPSEKSSGDKEEKSTGKNKNWFGK